MKSKRFSLCLLFTFILLGCTSTTPTATVPPVTDTVPPTATLVDAALGTTRVPEALPVAQAYLDAWKAEDYAAMYQLLTKLSRSAVTEEDFTKRYTEVAANAALTNWDAEVLASLVKSPYTAEVNYKVSLHSVLVGDIVRDTVMSLVLEDGQWKIQWDDALILPELKGGNTLRMEIEAPARAMIYDRNGHALVGQASAVSIGLNAGDIPEEPGDLYALLQRLTGVSAQTIQERVDANRSFNGYVPVGSVSDEDVNAYLGTLSSYSGMVLEPFSARYYYDAAAPHVVGFMSSIQPDEVEYYKRLGYAWNERVGRMGLEYWGEPYLGGTRGGKLYVTSPEGATITLLAERGAQPAQAIHTTIDKDLQEAAQLALNGLQGAIVVIEKDTGRVLAMASSPGFDPNLFEPANYNSYTGLQNLPGTYNVNRAAQGTYPLGSVFKIITMAAGLESGHYQKDSEYNCEYHFTELHDVVLNDWTWEHYQEDGKTQASGILTLQGGLMRSCNPWFYHIGLDLYNKGLTTAVSDMAKGFGLGSLTGIELAEQAGNIPEPASQLDATNNAIGQGSTLVTPLQVADFIAAIANGGTLYRPTVIEKIVPPVGEPTYVFTATERGTLPVSPENLAIIQDAMKMVVDEPRGTAYRPVGMWLRSYNVSVAGKTGTAQSGGGKPHAWFAGYSTENREDLPDIAVAVVLEYQGEGSEWAAPVFARAVVYSYFYPGVRPVLPWETRPGLWSTETPEVSETPTPEVTETPAP
ncbi:MAG: penicillin-binding transpeptidase domain-containing protein [Chloroflexota bacterium]